MRNHMRWLSDVIPMEALGKPAEVIRSIGVIDAPPAEMCMTCRGAKLLCGKARCPIIVKAQSLVKHAPHLNSELIQGDSPGGIFVGRFGYPKVHVGPLVPPFSGDTEILDTPEMWLDKSIDDIVDYRFSLIRGSTRANITDVQEGGRLIENFQELAMASEPVATELMLERKPSHRLFLSEDSQPFGPSAPLKNVVTSSIHVDGRIEKAFYDRDMKASEAVVDLYRKGVLVSRVQRAFSVGMFGLGSLRKLVPTRWSITAVDSTVSLSLIDELKHHPTIDEYRVYSYSRLDNLYVAIFIPEPWKFEWIEAWFPNTTWNLYDKKPALMGDYEEYWGRSTYASVGGCYYSTRLAVAESLCQERKQASALLLREIHPSYILPVGVWNVRESIRAMLKTKPSSFDSLQDAVAYAMSKLTIPPKNWIEASSMLKGALFQKRITEYMKKTSHSKLS